MKKIFCLAGMICAVLWGMIFCACRQKNELPQESTAAETEMESQIQDRAEIQESDLAKGGNQSVHEIPVEFPFGKEYSLTLVSKEEITGEYELRLYDANQEILQQIPCGQMKEPIGFSYDAICGWANLEIFPADSCEGLLFCWDGQRFLEDGIKIPRYEKALWPSAMLVVEEDNTRQIKKICQINEEQKCVEEIRRWELEKDTGELKIWDYPDDQNLFTGIVSVKEDGKLTNQEYYDMLLLEDLYVRYDCPGEERTIPIWIDEPRSESTEDSREIEPFENVRAAIFGDNGHTAEYESRETLLQDFGVKDQAPLYQYYDRQHNLRLELYKEQASEAFCGIVYEYYLDSNQKKWVVVQYGFTIGSAKKQKWVKEDTFSTRTVYGDDGTKFVLNPEEIMEYTSAGNFDYYRCQGITEGEADGELEDTLCTVVEINYIYRDDGTLFCKDYWHDSLIFGSTLCSLKSLYDEKGRILYERGYITHGELEYYYIYEDEGEKPAYCLLLDYAGGYAIPQLVQYD